VYEFFDNVRSRGSVGKNVDNVVKGGGERISVETKVTSKEIKMEWGRG